MKIFYFLAAVICLVLIVIGFKRTFEDVNFTLESVAGIPTTTSTPSVGAKLEQMSLEEKIGQMMVIGFENPYADDHIREMITKYHIGGVNLLRRNVGGREDVIGMNAELKSINDSVTDIPFMIATDQEGGAYSRFKFITHQEPQLEFDSIAEAYDESYGRGQELKELGVTAIFGPVVDYVTDKSSYLYHRSFGDKIDEIAPLSEAMMKGYEDAGLKSTIKHFPGYGNITADPHRVAAKINSRAYYEKSTVPFQKLMEGNQDGAVMTAHVITAGSEGKPATFSERLLKDVARNRWGFDGVIITDDLEMVSAGRSDTVPELAVKAVIAGNDMIISTFTTALHAQIHEALVQAVKEGRIREEQVNKSVERILRWKGYGEGRVISKGQTVNR